MYWFAFILAFMVIPVLLVLLLLLPDPVQRYVSHLVDVVLFKIHIFSTKLIYFVIVVSVASFGLSLRHQLGSLHTELVAKQAGQLDSAKGARCTRWRDERNMYICALSLTMWLALLRIHSLTKEVGTLRRLAKAE
mmetsp:Transcript_6683/g.22519  ORF Transcript_6683/g.22519 Transcript_6683/m.22519 type:complete len:135 (-) Transcript_6683:54-458(-)|eukprot:CAMPEP_0198441982 /NCGR_PEP_ID=MMETSP1452-20131203/64794_1 /TAXON_ID=1181717 /ORGANISM="Synchroma pusillum, Strain CCMP3072" /LENGTH=134 /DNA_ID=CAMNT_0044162611 /DNA_START=45 /DNA_END=449 /DNA_ORIENTATION=+